MNGLGFDGASFAVMTEYSGWLTFDSLNLRSHSNTTSFNGIYRTNAHDGASSDFAWMFNPNKPGQIDIVEIYSFTANGVTTVTGLYYSFGGNQNQESKPLYTELGSNNQTSQPVSNVQPTVSTQPTLPTLKLPNPATFANQPSIPPNGSVQPKVTVNNIEPNSPLVTNHSVIANVNGPGSFISGLNTTSLTGNSSAGSFNNVLTVPLVPILTPAVPEPEEYAMMLLGFGMVGFHVRRKQKAV